MGIATLKQLALTKGQYVPTLNVMVPYLEFADNQEYLVKRIRGEHPLNHKTVLPEYCLSRIDSRRLMRLMSMTRN